jgi:hypothetical protein
MGPGSTATLFKSRLFWGCFHPRALRHTKNQHMHCELEIQSDSLDDKENETLR